MNKIVAKSNVIVVYLPAQKGMFIVVMLLCFAHFYERLLSYDELRSLALYSFSHVTMHNKFSLDLLTHRQWVFLVFNISVYNLRTLSYHRPSEQRVQRTSWIPVHLWEVLHPSVLRDHRESCMLKCPES